MTDSIGKLIGSAIARGKAVRPVATITPEEYERYATVVLALGFDDMTPVNFKAVVEYKWALETGNARKGICIMGMVGRGKSAAFRALGFRILGARRLVEVYAEAEGAVADTMRRDKPLALDDLGAEKTHVHFGSRVEVMDEVIDMRHLMYQRYGTLTHVATNNTEDEIDVRYGPRLMSRVHEMTKVIVFEGPDRRKG